MDVSGLLTWTAGEWLGTGAINANGGALFDGADAILNSRTLNLAVGQIATQMGASGRFFFRNGSVVNNAGTFLAQNDQGLQHNTGVAGTFNNIGTFTRNTSAGLFSVLGNAIFNNTGVVNVNTGTLHFDGGDTGNTTGDFNVAAGAPLNFASAFNFAASADLSGAGTVRFSHGVSNLNGSNYNVATFEITGLGSVSVNGTASFATLNLAGGT